jgi:dTDP-4-dehydrorhamnose reductase
MKILIIGGRGQLGSDCTRVLRGRHEVVSVGSRELDITRPKEAEETIGQIGPDIILNCGAFTRVDACETEKGLAWTVNVEGPQNLALAAKKLGATMIHISTDYVFDGRREVPQPYTEEDAPGPQSYYGITKLAGEEALRKATDDHMVLRTAWLYGFHGNNFLKTMLRLALEDPKREIKVVNDQFGSPTWAYRLALQIDRLIDAHGRGTYHATSEGYCTWYELAEAFLKKMGLPHTLVPCTTAEYPLPAPRPGNSILENRRLKAAGMDLMTHWRSDMEAFVDTYGDRLIKEVRKATP